MLYIPKPPSNSAAAYLRYGLQPLLIVHYEKLFCDIPPPPPPLSLPSLD